MQGASLQPLLQTQNAANTASVGAILGEDNKTDGLMSFEQAFQQVINPNVNTVSRLKVSFESIAVQLDGKELPNDGELLPISEIPIPIDIVSLPTELSLETQSNIGIPVVAPNPNLNGAAASSRASEQGWSFTSVHPALATKESLEHKLDGITNPQSKFTAQDADAVPVISTPAYKQAPENFKPEVSTTLVEISNDITKSTVDKVAAQYSLQELQALMNKSTSKMTTHAATSSSSFPEIGSLQAMLNPAATQSLTATLPLNLATNPTASLQALSENIFWMANNEVKSATIQLDPPELGQLQIRLSVEQDKVSVNFVTHNQPAKEALDAAIPRLRDMFQASGFDLVDVDVANHGQHSQAGAQSRDDEGRGLNPPIISNNDDSHLNSKSTDRTEGSADSLSVNLIDDYV